MKRLRGVHDAGARRPTLPPPTRCSVVQIPIGRETLSGSVNRATSAGEYRPMGIAHVRSTAFWL
eukprot:7463303-Alexandrium_andersonii.AAC.1